jgi:hypothetical protein
MLLTTLKNGALGIISLELDWRRLISLRAAAPDFALALKADLFASLFPVQESYKTYKK